MIRFQLGCNPDRLIPKTVDLANFKTVKAATAEIEGGLLLLIFEIGLIIVGLERSSKTIFVKDKGTFLHKVTGVMSF